MIVTGRARVFGDDVNTDYVVSSARKRETIDATQLARYLFESIDPAFAASIKPGDLLVGGKNFGCGSAMEVAATVIQATGIRAVLARTFARSFYRNAINNGLLIVECDTSFITEGDEMRVRLDDVAATVENVTGNRTTTGAPLPAIMRGILEAGGLVEYLVKNTGVWRF